MMVADTVVPNGELRAPRTNLFLAADMSSPGEGRQPVKIRNLSPSGAMLQAAALPARGVLVRLSRGGLQVGGTVVWTDGPRCGVAFDGSVSVRDWMATPPPGGALVRPAADRQSLPLHLQLAARLLEQLGDALCADPEVLVRHGTDLQKLDIVVQMLSATAGALQHRPGQQQRLADLRASAEEALRPLHG